MTIFIAHVNALAVSTIEQRKLNQHGGQTAEIQTKEKENRNMASYILDKAYKITDASGVGAHLIVVQGANAGECVLPGAANAGAILGTTVHGQSLQNNRVMVRKAGIAHVTASGAIALGDPVCTNKEGRALSTKSFPEENSLPAHHRAFECLGFAESSAEEDGDILQVFISLHQRLY